MKIGFMNTEFEPGQDAARLGPQPTPVRDFLCRFDAIFTLNQDTLVEQKYSKSNLQQGSSGKWFELQSPGLTDVLVNGQRFEPPGVFVPASPPFTLLKIASRITSFTVQVTGAPPTTPPFSFWVATRAPISTKSRC